MPDPNNEKNFLPEDHPEIRFGKTGIILSNLGTPDGYDYFSMRKYLNQFLSDKRVIDYPRWKWQPILQSIILTKRPFTSGKNYQKIWNHQLDESPLLTITRHLTDNIRSRLVSEIGSDYIVDFAMRYGNPSIGSVVNGLIKQGCNRIVFFPLYPQYSATTTATACDSLFDTLKQLNWQPSVRIVEPYFENGEYISALAKSIKTKYNELSFEPEVLLASYHGLPKRYLLEGDPYHCQCQKTTRLLIDSLGRDFNPIHTTFQSTFGKEIWLQPYTIGEVKRLAQSGVKNLAIICPGFSSDCIETLEEIQMEVREEFEAHGGKNFAYIPALNDTDDHSDLIYRIILENLGGWLS